MKIYKLSGVPAGCFVQDLSKGGVVCVDNVLKTTYLKKGDEIRGFEEAEDNKFDDFDADFGYAPYTISPCEKFKKDGYEQILACEARKRVVKLASDIENLPSNVYITVVENLLTGQKGGSKRLTTINFTTKADMYGDITTPASKMYGEVNIIEDSEANMLNIIERVCPDAKIELLPAIKSHFDACAHADKVEQGLKF